MFVTLHLSNVALNITKRWHFSQFQDKLKSLLEYLDQKLLWFLWLCFANISVNYLRSKINIFIFLLLVSALCFCPAKAVTEQLGGLSGIKDIQVLWCRRACCIFISGFVTNIQTIKSGTWMYSRTLSSLGVHALSLQLSLACRGSQCPSSNVEEAVICSSVIFPDSIPKGLLQWKAARRDKTVKINVYVSFF